jgi:hypothetical protein
MSVHDIKRTIFHLCLCFSYEINHHSNDRQKENDVGKQCNEGILWFERFRLIRYPKIEGKNLINTCHTYTLFDYIQHTIVK